MRALRWSTWCWLLVLGGLAWACASGLAAHGQEARFTSSALSEPARQGEAPDKARQVLQAIQERGGQPVAGYVGGRHFHNRERRLPRGRYREYDVNPKLPGRPRDAERIVIEQRTQKAYYSPDHYQTFVPLN